MTTATLFWVLSLSSFLINAASPLCDGSSCLSNEMAIDSVSRFEGRIAAFFGAPYAIAVDSATHGLELSLRYLKDHERLRENVVLEIPTRTEMSVSFLPEKLGMEWVWKEERWEDFYYIGGTPVVDAAMLWREDSYITGTFMVS